MSVGSGGSKRCDDLLGFLPRYASTTVDADGNFAVNRGATNDSLGRAVVIDGIVLRRLIVPNGDIASAPTPAHRVLRLGDLVIKQLNEQFGVAPAQADEALYERA